MIGPVAAPGLHVMTYNIRRRMPHVERGSVDHWSRRRPLLERVLRAEQPSLIGVQEALAHQERFITDTLGPDYRAVGYGRNANGMGERCPIVYDTRRLELQRWTQLALSDDPHRAGSRSWGNRIPRMLVSARFRDLETDRELLFVNVHFDHESRDSRLESARMIASLVAEVDRPTIVTGDFNSDVGTLPYEELTNSGELKDAWEIADERLSSAIATYSGYRPPGRGKRIDWMLTSPQIAVSVIGINAVRYDGFAPSDHEPVQAVVRVGE